MVPVSAELLWLYTKIWLRFYFYFNCCLELNFSAIDGYLDILNNSFMYYN